MIYLNNSSIIQRGQIYYVDLSGAVGSEEQGIRPCVVVSNNTGNYHSPTITIAPISNKPGKDYLPVHVNPYSDCLDSDSRVLLEQIRTVDKQRIQRFSTSLFSDEMSAIDRAIKVSLGLERRFCLI
jgi:mRNA interferase MazF